MSGERGSKSYSQWAVRPIPVGMTRRFRRNRDERGANLVEYCLLIVLIVLACLGGVSQFGKKVPSESFSSIAAGI
jgi:Flp pilus assembly pilin Flp